MCESHNLAIFLDPADEDEDEDVVTW